MINCAFIFGLIVIGADLIEKYVNSCRVECIREEIIKDPFGKKKIDINFSIT